MKKSNILITGIAGFLGTELTRQLSDTDHTIYGISHSESSEELFSKNYPKIKIFNLDISTNKELLNRIVQENDIDYIIHAAALKHVGICENNPTRAVDVNVIGSKNIIQAALNNKVKNLIAISTDKAKNPAGVYGYTKSIMEKLATEAGYSYIRGVNFLFSTGSVLDIWNRQRNEGKPLLINSVDMIRYFVSVEYMARVIIDNLNNNNNFDIDFCFRIGLHNLHKYYSEYFNYPLKETFESTTCEKLEEEIAETIQVLYPLKEELYSIFKRNE